MSRSGWLAALVFAFMVAASGTALAQEGGAGGGGGQDRGGRGGRGGGGDFDPAQFRERMMQRFKEDLGASDEDWKVIQPKLEKVMAAQRETRGGGGGFGGFGGGGRGRGGDGGGGARGGDQEQTAVAKASNELRTALQSKDTPADDIAKRLEAYRAARAKAREDLAAAQKELKEVLTGRQEAQLVMSGMLE